MSCRDCRRVPRDATRNDECERRLEQSVVAAVRSVARCLLAIMANDRLDSINRIVHRRRGRRRRRMRSHAISNQQNSPTGRAAVPRTSVSAELKLIHTAAPDTTRTGLFCRVWCGDVN